MKKFFSLIVLASAMFFTACTPASKLESAIAEANQECPMYLDEGLTITKIYSEENNVVYECRFDEELNDMTVDQMDNPLVTSIMKEAMVEELSNNPDSDLREFISTCKEAKYNIIYRFIGTETNYSFDIQCFYDEL